MAKFKKATRKARQIKGAKLPKKKRGGIELIKNSGAVSLPKIALDHPEAWELIAKMKLRDTMDFKKKDEKTVSAITKAQTSLLNRTFFYSHINNDYARIELTKDGKRVYRNRNKK